MISACWPGIHKTGSKQPSFCPNQSHNSEDELEEDGPMSKNELQPRQDKLIDQYREIGPAVLVAALMSKTNRKNEERGDNTRHSILAVKKSG